MGDRPRKVFDQDTFSEPRPQRSGLGHLHRELAMVTLFNQAVAA